MLTDLSSIIGCLENCSSALIEWHKKTFPNNRKSIGTCKKRLIAMQEFSTEVLLEENEDI